MYTRCRDVSPNIRYVSHWELITISINICWYHQPCRQLREQSKNTPHTTTITVSCYWTNASTRCLLIYFSYFIISWQIKVTSMISKFLPWENNPLDRSSYHTDIWGFEGIFTYRQLLQFNLFIHKLSLQKASDPIEREFESPWTCDDHIKAELCLLLWTRPSNICTH